MMHAGIRSTLVYCAVIFALTDAASYHRPGDTYPRPPPAPGSPTPGAPNQGSSNQGANNNNQNGVFVKIASPAQSYPIYSQFPLAPFPQYPQFPSTKRVDSVGANTWSWDWNGIDGVKIVNYQPPSIRWGPSGIRRDSFTQGNPIYIQRPSYVPSVHLTVPDRKVISPIKHLDPAPLPTPHDPPTKKTNPTITPTPKTSTRTKTTRPSYSEQQTTENDSRSVSLPVATSPLTITTTEFSAPEIINNMINEYYDETTLAAVDLPLQTSEIELNPTTTRTTIEMDYYDAYDQHVPTPDPE